MRVKFLAQEHPSVCPQPGLEPGPLGCFPAVRILAELKWNDDIPDLTQQDGCKTQDCRMTYKNVAQDRECTVSRHIFSSFCPPESYRRPVAQAP